MSATTKLNSLNLCLLFHVLFDSSRVGKETVLRLIQVCLIQFGFCSKMLFQDPFFETIKRWLCVWFRAGSLISIIGRWIGFVFVRMISSNQWSSRTYKVTISILLHWWKLFLLFDQLWVSVSTFKSVKLRNSTFRGRQKMKYNDADWPMKMSTKIREIWLVIIRGRLVCLFVFL